MEYMNNYTGEVYTGVWHMVTTIIRDIIHHPGCRTIKMLSITKLKAE